MHKGSMMQASMLQALPDTRAAEQLATNEDTSTATPTSSSTAAGLCAEPQFGLATQPGEASTSAPAEQQLQQLELTPLSDCSPSGRSDSPGPSRRLFDRNISNPSRASSGSLMEVQQLESRADDAGKQAARLMQKCSFEVFELEEQDATEVKYLRGALSKKEEECEHLRSIIKELSTSRARVHKTKVELEEQYTALQRQYMRVVKVAELARAASQASTSTSGRTKKELAEAKLQLARSQRVAEAAKDRARALRQEVHELRRQLVRAEAGRPQEDCRQSVCLREYAWQQCLFLV